MNYAKLVSFLGLIATIAAAVNSQVGAINATAGKWVMFAGIVAAASGGALAKLAEFGRLAVGLGLIVAVTMVVGQAEFASLFTPLGVQIAAILGTMAAAAGESIFGWESPAQQVGK